MDEKVVDELIPSGGIALNVEDLLVSRMTDKLFEFEHELEIKEPQTIYRVLPTIRGEDNGAYDPKIISIGPYHQDNKELQPMQPLKWRFLHDLIGRSRANSLDNYIKVVRSLESRARNCYSGVVQPDSDAFVEMLVLDGCFIIELLVKFNIGGKDDKLCAVNWTLPLLKNDFLLLENQIPFFILQSLFDASVVPDLSDKQGSDCYLPLTLLALNFLIRDVMDISVPDSASHLLQLFHITLCQNVDGNKKLSTVPCATYVMKKLKRIILYSFYWCLSFILYCRLPPDDEAIAMSPRMLPSATELKEDDEEIVRAPRMLPSATELKEAGVRFKAKKTARNFLDVTFEDGVLEMPIRTIQAATIPLFRNLLAFEQCSPQYESYFTSYVSFMDNLIDTSEDVLVLEGCGILESKLGGEGAVTEFFNSLRMGTYLDYDGHYLKDLFKEVKEYSASEIHQWRARLVHDYFGNPWSIISLIAAIVLLILAAIQSFFAVLAYLSPP